MNFLDKLGPVPDYFKKTTSVNNDKHRPAEAQTSVNITDSSSINNELLADVQPTAVEETTTAKPSPSVPRPDLGNSSTGIANLLSQLGLGAAVPTQAIPDSMLGQRKEESSFTMPLLDQNYASFITGHLQKQGGIDLKGLSQSDLAKVDPDLDDFMTRSVQMLGGVNPFGDNQNKAVSPEQQIPAAFNLNNLSKDDVARLDPDFNDFMSKNLQMLGGSNPFPEPPPKRVSEQKDPKRAYGIYPPYATDNWQSTPMPSIDPLGKPEEDALGEQRFENDRMVNYGNRIGANYTAMTGRIMPVNTMNFLISPLSGSENTTNTLADQRWWDNYNLNLGAHYGSLTTFITGNAGPPSGPYWQNNIFSFLGPEAARDPLIGGMANFYVPYSFPAYGNCPSRPVAVKPWPCQNYCQPWWMTGQTNRWR